jgi:hypothetical protein
MAQKYVPVALRRLVRARANECCEYCLIPESLTLATHWVDHVVAEKHGGLTEENNLALSCVLCNQHKGSDLTSIDPQTGLITPFFTLAGTAGSITSALPEDGLNPSHRPGGSRCACCNGTFRNGSKSAN